MRVLFPAEHRTELTPEWFYLPEMFENLNKYDLGKKQVSAALAAVSVPCEHHCQDGSKVGDVQLPEWAPTPEDFVRYVIDALCPASLKPQQSQPTGTGKRIRVAELASLDRSHLGLQTGLSASAPSHECPHLQNIAWSRS